MSGWVLQDIARNAARHARYGLRPRFADIAGRNQDMKYCRAIKTSIGAPSIQPNMYLSIICLPAV